jgi:hypothetical protein
MPFISQIEAVFVTGSLKWNRAIDEKYRVINIVSSIEFRKKLLWVHVISCQFKHCMS